MTPFPVLKNGLILNDRLRKKNFYVYIQYFSDRAKTTETNVSFPILYFAQSHRLIKWRWYSILCSWYTKRIVRWYAY
jgi:hypothetical protein